MDHGKTMKGCGRVFPVTAFKVTPSQRIARCRNERMGIVFLFKILVSLGSAGKIAGGVKALGFLILGGGRQTPSGVRGDRFGVKARGFF